MRRILGYIAIIFFALLFLLIIANIIHVIWIYVNPEGFWSFNLFSDFLRTAAVFLILGIATILFVIYFIYQCLNYIFSSILKNKVEKPNLLQLLGFWIFFLLLNTLNFFWFMGPNFYFDQEMAKINSYIEQSEDLIDKGQYEEAINDAKKAYENSQQSKYKPLPFLILTKLYLNTDWAKSRILSKEYATTFNYAYSLHKSYNSIDKAEQLYKDALKISELESFKTYITYKVLPLTYLGNLCMAQGRYKEAEEYFNVLLSIDQNLNKEDIEYVLTAYFLNASYATKIGDFGRANKLKVDALKLYENNEGSLKSIFYLQLLLAAIEGELSSDHLEEAGKLLVKAQDLAEDREEKEIFLSYLKYKGLYCTVAAIKNAGNPDLIKTSLFESITNFFSSGTSNRNKFIHEAEKCFIKLVEENEDRFGYESPAYAESLTLLASFYIKQQNFNEANALFEKALVILQKTEKDNQEGFNNILLHSVISSFYNKEFSKIGNPIKEVENFHLNKLNAKYLFLTEDEKEKYISNIENTFNSINSIYFNLNNEDSNKRLYNNILAVKSIALLSNQHLRKYLNNQPSPLYNEYYKIIADKERIEALKNGNNEILIQDAENKLKLREKRILEQVLHNPNYLPFDPRGVKWEDIKAKLNDGEVAIEITNLPTKPYTTDSITYFALILKKSFESPKIVPLFKEEDLLKLLNKSGNNGIEKINNIYSNEKAALYNLVWRPLESHLIDCSHIDLSVSGVLHQVSFPAILIDTKYKIDYLSSTRELADVTKSKDKEKSAALFGDINYERPNKNPNKDKFSSASTERFGFKNLKYSAVEINAIRGLIEKSFVNSVKVFTDTAANETQIRKLNKLPLSILHISAHGYYFKSNTAMAANGLLLSNQNNSSILNRSGILLSRSNSYNNKDSENDGILTAKEISKLDLSNLDLVVLSACETGLGDIKGGEGVFGLQRAFKLAGAKSMLVSLWKVPDEQTAMLMKYFYEFHIGGGLSKTEALKQAQLKVREKFKSPFYWAGFTLLSN